jgi:hypothetical protein
MIKFKGVSLLELSIIALIIVGLVWFVFYLLFIVWGGVL